MVTTGLQKSFISLTKSKVRNGAPQKSYNGFLNQFSFTRGTTIDLSGYFAGKQTFKSTPKLCFM